MNDKVVLIVGATSMIGRACAHLFSQQGMKLMLVAQDKNKLDNLVKELTAQVESCIADICVEADVKSIISKTIKSFQRIDGVMQNVAVYPWKPIDELELIDWISY